MREPAGSVKGGLRRGGGCFSFLDPPMRRALEIFLTFTAATGHEHPYLRTIFANYAKLLQKLGRPWPPDLPKPGGKTISPPRHKDTKSKKKRKSISHE
jgi:hypothetical protein